MISLAAQILFILYGVVLSVPYFRKALTMRGVLSIMASMTPFLYSVSFPSSSTDFDAQLEYWFVAIALVCMSGIAMLLLALTVPLNQKSKRYIIAANILLLIFIFLAPVHRAHHGWGDEHSHFFWENPFHMH